MRQDYERWLRGQGYGEGTILTQLGRLRRVEEHHGDLDRHYKDDGLGSLIRTLTYSTDEGRRGRPNPSGIPIEGDVRNGLASLKNAVVLYLRFCGERAKPPAGAGAPAAGLAPEGAPSPVPPAPAPARAVPPAPAPRRPSRRGAEADPVAAPRTLRDFGLDGRAALEAIIATSRYETVAQAVASLTLFSHPATVRQTGGRAIFQAIRDPRSEAGGADRRARGASRPLGRQHGGD